MLIICHGRSGLIERNLLNRFQDIHESASFQRSITHVVQHSHAVFVEYPFFASIVIPICKQHNVPCLLTAHDVHALAIKKSPDTRKKILEMEMEALRSADFSFCVSDSDRHFFKRHGISTTCVPNPIDRAACQPLKDKYEISRFRIKYCIENRPVCMFVGSRIIPNIEAVDEIRRITEHRQDCQFVIARKCAAPGRRNNLISLGLISSEDLKRLYALCDIVIMPIRTGTGTSLKFVEALSYGKPIIASSVAARGYWSRSRKGALICDDFKRIPELINELMKDPSKRQSLSEQAVSQAQQYDFRNIFRIYTDTLNKF